MAPVTGALLDRMVQAIVDEVHPERIILFGSRARGDERENSDIDLIVLEADPFGSERNRRKETVRLYHALAGFHVPADILPATNCTQPADSTTFLSACPARILDFLLAVLAVTHGLRSSFRGYAACALDAMFYGPVSRS